MNRRTKADCVEYCFRALENQSEREMSDFYKSAIDIKRARDTVYVECKLFCYKNGYELYTFSDIWSKAIKKYSIAHGIPIK